MFPRGYRRIAGLSHILGFFIFNYLTPNSKLFMLRLICNCTCCQQECLEVISFLRKAIKFND